MRMTIAGKLWAGFAVILSLQVLTGLLIHANTQKTRRALERLTTVAAPLSRTVEALEDIITDLEQSVLRYLEFGSPESREQMAGLEPEFQQFRTRYEQMMVSQEDRRRAAEFAALFGECYAAGRGLVEDRTRQSVLRQQVAEDLKKMNAIAEGLAPPGGSEVQEAVETKELELQEGLTELSIQLDNYLLAPAEPMRTRIADQISELGRRLARLSLPAPAAQGPPPKEAFVNLLRRTGSAVDELLPLSKRMHDNVLQFANKSSRLESFLNDQIQGAAALNLAAARASVVQAERANRAVLVFALLGVVLTGGVTAVAVSRSIMRSVHLLSEGARKIGGGELGHRIGEVSGDELGRVADAFNTMAEQRQRAELALRANRARMVRSERMASMGRLADGLADALGRILQPALSGPEERVRSLADAGRHAPELQKMKRVGAEAAALIEDLRIVGAGSLGRLHRLDASELVEQYVHQHRAAWSAAFPALELRTDLGRGLPTISGSRLHLQRALDNLVRSALSRMSGRGLLTLSTALEEVAQPIGHYESGDRGRYVVIRVQDDGPEIAPEVLESIFEPFHPARGQELLNGRGLAMTLVYRVVKALRGYIDVLSTPDNGTEFLLYFPVYGSEEGPREEDAADYSGSETVLVLDDAASFRDQAEDLLGSLGYTVLKADHSDRALELMRTAAVDLVVLDLVLGEPRDGVEVFKRVREMAPSMKAVLVSGFAEFSRIVEGRKLGIGQFVQKPYTLEALGRAVRRELDADLAPAPPPT